MGGYMNGFSLNPCISRSSLFKCKLFCYTLQIHCENCLLSQSFINNIYEHVRGFPPEYTLNSTHVCVQYASKNNLMNSLSHSLNWCLPLLISSNGLHPSLVSR